MSDLISRQQERQSVAQKYAFGNDEFSLEAAYHDCKLVFDGITDDDSFQEADTGLILYYANEIIYALQKALDVEIAALGKDTDAHATADPIDRAAAYEVLSDYYHHRTELQHMALRDALSRVPSAQPEIIRCKDCKHKPHTSDKYNHDNGDCGFEIIFPDYRCPCRCDDEYYNYLPADDWFCGNAERKTDE